MQQVANHTKAVQQKETYTREIDKVKIVLRCVINITNTIIIINLQRHFWLWKPLQEGVKGTQEGASAKNLSSVYYKFLISYVNFMRILLQKHMIFIYV